MNVASGSGSEINIFVIPLCFLLWTVVNLWDALGLDILWFCHDPRFVLPGTEDMTADYHDYGFHLKGFCIGEALALVVCALAGLVVRFVL